MSSTENRINAHLARWRMTIETFTVAASLLGALPGTSRSAAQRSLSGIGLPFGAEAALALDKFAHDLNAVIDAASPLPLSLKNPAEISLLVEAWRTGRLSQLQ